MRSGLVVIGVIFLVLGGLLYFVPMQQIKADTTTGGDGSVDTRTSSASITVPVGWAYASAIIGFILLVIGLASSGSAKIVQPLKVVQGPRGPRGKTGPVRRRRRSVRSPRKSSRVALPKGTTVTTTTRIRR